MTCPHHWYLLETVKGWVHCCAFCGEWRIPETDTIVKEASED